MESIISFISKPVVKAVIMLLGLSVASLMIFCQGDDASLTANLIVKIIGYLMAWVLLKWGKVL